jgi:hypothetical protein
MSNKTRRRVKIAAGAILAGAAIPIAAAGTAWADEEISRDGTVVFDNFPGGPARGSSDIGSAALSGASNDTAIYRGPASDYATAAAGAATGAYGANDASTGDANDMAKATNTSTAYMQGATGSHATATGTDSYATVYGASATDLVTNSSATATNGGTAVIVNDGDSSTTSFGHDLAHSSGTGSADVVDSSDSAARSVNTGTFGSADVFDATNSSAYAQGTGSVGEVLGTLTAPITGSSAVDTNGTTTDVTASDTQEFNTHPDFGAASTNPLATDAAAVHIPLLP